MQPTPADIARMERAFCGGMNREQLAAHSARTAERRARQDADFARAVASGRILIMGGDAFAEALSGPAA